MAATTSSPLGRSLARSVVGALVLASAPLLAATLPTTTPAATASALPAAAGPTAALVADEASPADRVVVYRDASGQVVPPGLARHVDPTCSGTGSDGPRVTAMYVRERSAPDRFAASRPVITAELRYIDDVFAMSAEPGTEGRRVRWSRSGTGCAPEVLDVVVPDGSLRSFDATARALEALGHDRADRKYLAFADVAVGQLPGGACGMAYKLDDDVATGNANDGTRAQHARVDRDCWSVDDRTYVSAALHELLHTMGALQDSAPNSSGSGHCSDAADVMCYDDSASGGGAPRQVCPEQQRWQLDCGRDDYFNTAPAPGSYLATHWNLASSSFLDPAPAMPAAPVGVAAPTTPSTVAGEVARLRAEVPPGATVRWAMDDPRCDTADAPATGLGFTVRCFNAGTVMVDGTVVGAGPTASHLSVPVTFTSSGLPRLAVSAPLVTGAGSSFDVSAELLNRRSGTWTTTWYARHPDCRASRTGPESATVTCGAAAQGARVLVGAVSTRAEDGSSQDRSVPVQIQEPGFPTVGIQGPAQVAVGDPAGFRAVVEGARVAAYAWSSRGGHGTGATDRASYTVEPPVSTQRSQDSLQVVVTLTDGRALTLSTGYDVVPELSVRIDGPARLAEGGSATYTARTNLPATVTWEIDADDCTVTPTGNRATVRCGSGASGPVTLLASAVGAGDSDSERTTVTVGGAPQTVKEPSTTALTAFRRGFKAVVRTAFGPVASAPVVLKVKAPRQKWSRVGVARTNARGTAVFKIRTNARATYRAVTRAGTGHLASRSPRVRSGR
ncbi:hypothetical protein KLP28_16000 [Nocardioidaceae bacterium]|nr:hypothetical protein KLP28_16000 [Nocardioidaceae bacterium]